MNMLIMLGYIGLFLMDMILDQMTHTLMLTVREVTTWQVIFHKRQETIC